MRTAIVATAALVLIGTAALAQDEQEVSRPKVGIGSKTMTSCTMDEKKYCADTPEGIMKECLVRNWMRISGDCQDAVAVPIKRAGGTGR